MRQGWKTSEFWLTFVATALSFAYASGLLDEAPPLVAKIAALVAAALGAVGYTVSRTLVKMSDDKRAVLTTVPVTSSAAPDPSQPPSSP
jgi:hypothetical protein